jgi:fumarate hydratase subunit beta
MNTISKPKKLHLPQDKKQASLLECGDSVLLSGVIYTARDAAHKRMIELLDKDLELPFPVNGALLYYVGPTPAKPGRAIGSAGPTTSSRMDIYSPRLLDLGLMGMIGKGKRSRVVIDAMGRNGAVYFGATGGAGALLSDKNKKAEVIAFEDLGAEAIHRLEVVDFPVVVIIDSKGNNLYEKGRKDYLEYN